MDVVGLTGGIASGKSSVARRLRERGVAVIDADLVAREVVQVGEPALEAIRRRFGDEILERDGTLKRKALGAIVFADPSALADLNAITHPAIMQRVAEKVSAHREAGHRWVVYEAALILENKLSPGLSALVAVLCDPEVQLARILTRDGLSEEAARQRLGAQTDNATREARADYLIHNNGTLTALIEATDALIDTLNARFH